MVNFEFYYKRFVALYWTSRKAIS